MRGPMSGTSWHLGRIRRGVQLPKSLDRKGMIVDPTDPTGPNIKSRNKAETTQQPSSLRTPLKSSRIELAGDRMILLPRLSFPQTQNSVS